jgi:hypothetical protein
LSRRCQLESRCRASSRPMPPVEYRKSMDGRDSAGIGRGQRDTKGSQCNLLPPLAHGYSL